MKESKMLRAICYGILLSSAYVTAKTIDGNGHIIYSPEEMHEHKRNCIKQISTNPVNLQDPTYHMQRALLCITADDTDYIPKVAGAGEIFYNGTTAYQLMHNGVKVILNSYYDSQWLTDVIQGLKGHHEPQEEKCFYEVLKYIPENATMIELGSYWAYYSLWFASQIKNAKNYLIEPDPRRLEIGIKNFELNNKNGTFKRGFVGRMKDTEPDITGAEWIAIDDFIESEGIEHINILHSDIQGAEAEMLETTIKYLDIIDYFFISTHGPQCHQPCLRFLEQHGFIILAENPDSEKTGCDGLIVAKRKGVAGPENISIKK